MASKRTLKKAVKKLHPITVLFLVPALLIGALGGYLVSKQLTKNDAFTLQGQKEIFLYVGQEYSYREEGFSVFEMGKDISSQVVVTTTLEKAPDGSYKVDTSAPGVYGIFYTVSDSEFYQNVKRVRTIHVLAPQGGV